jgi:LEA14-like dessication related protein
MRKKTIKLLLIIVTILYILIGGLLFINIQVLVAPEIIMNIEVSEITPYEAILHSKIDIDNPNGFDVSVKNLKIITTAPDGYIVASVEIAGGKIPSNEKKTFSSNISIAFSGRSPEILTSKITGDVGMSVLFLEKTIPLKMGVVTSLEKILNDFAAPVISATVEFTEFNTDELSLSATIDVYNPNSFEIYIEDAIGEIKTETGKIIGEIDDIGGRIPPKESKEINTTGWMLLEALNAKKIIFNINASAGMKAAGFDKNLSFNAETKLIIPDFEELILSKDNPVLLSIKAKNKLSIKGLRTDIYLEIKNTYNVALTIRDINCKLYTEADGELNLLGEKIIEEDIVAEAGITSFAFTEIMVPFSKILTIKPSTDWLMVSVTARLTIKGIDPAVFVEIRGYTDIHIFS